MCRILIPEISRSNKIICTPDSYSYICHLRDRVGPLLKAAGRTEALEWLFRETQAMG